MAGDRASDMLRHTAGEEIAGKRTTEWPTDMSREPTPTSAGSAAALPGDAKSESSIAPHPTVLLIWDEQGECTSVRLGIGDDARDLPRLGGDGWLHMVHPEDRKHARALLRSVLGRASTGEIGVRLRGGDARAVLRIHRRRRGGAEGVLVDATRSLRSTARLARLGETLNQLRSEEDIVRAVLAESVAILGGSSGAVYVIEEETADLIMIGSIGLPADALLEEFARLPADAPLPGPDALRTGKPVIIRTPDERKRRYAALASDRVPFAPAIAVVPMYDASGEPFGVLGMGFPAAEIIDQIDEGLLTEVAAQCASAMHRARLTTAAEQNQEQLAFLDALSGALSRSFDVETALTYLAEFAVPRLADWCAVRMIESSSNPQPMVGAAHRDPAKVGFLRELAGRPARDFATWTELREAFDAGQPLVQEDTDPASLARGVGDPDIADGFAAVGAEAVVIFPLHARGRLIGALGLGNAPGRVFRQDEFDLAYAAAARAAVLVDNARLFAERSQVAEALQDSLLPGVLPDVPGIELGARYRPAGQGLDVGGDFYDAFQVDDERWIFAVGDVCGHGVEAASLTGLARHTIRSSGLSTPKGAPPSSMLSQLNRLLLQHLAEMSARHAAGSAHDQEWETWRFCTVLVGIVQPSEEAGVDVVVCSAGHPLPLVRRHDDTVVAVGAPGTLLGVTDDVTLSDVTVHLAPGETLVAYTDGVTDRRDGRRSFDEDGVISAVREGRNLSAQALAERIECDAMAFADGEPSDDMALLILRVSAS